jgi:hypothetical protein
MHLIMCTTRRLVTGAWTWAHLFVYKSSCIHPLTTHTLTGGGEAQRPLATTSRCPLGRAQVSLICLGVRGPIPRQIVSHTHTHTHTHIGAFLQGFSYRTFPTGRFLQDISYRTFLTGHFLQGISYRAYPTGRLLQDKSYSTFQGLYKHGPGLAKLINRAKSDSPN